MDSETDNYEEIKDPFDASEPSHPIHNYIYRNLHYDTAVTLIGLASITACILIIYIIKKREVLRTRTNIYVANLCMAYILYLLFSPLSLNLFGAEQKVPQSKLCILNETLMLVQFAVFSFASFLIVDSFDVLARFRSNYLLIAKSFWIIFVISFLIASTLCALGISKIPFQISAITELLYMFSFIFLLIVHIMKFVEIKTFGINKEEKNLGLTLATWHFLCWLINWLYCFVYMNVIKAGRVNYHIELFTYAIAHTYPMILLLLLYYKDEHFNISLKNLFHLEKLEGNVAQEELKSEKYSNTHV